ncbi:hypothetical protein [Limoniibacter endophyticus]|uniref:Gluconate 2-dehydrogenase subunit 3-like protein n=1 Tax=Limoniibacter endophyticus TaxID=1565040 RepID=A0A8J3DL21_9HYPH|nr:hypothetical protein [Limoniibacter endophyticus]GHC79045.1 hypothetical protein GCM10010136_31260 [Limoniibacter endophyticus]
MTTATKGLVSPSSTSPTAVAKTDPGGFPLDPAKDSASCKLLVRMVRAMYPHKRFGDAPYERTANAIFKAAEASPAQKVAFASALYDLAAAGFADLDEEAAYNHLKSIESTAFFKLVRSTAVVTLYDDPEVWELLGYEGPSFDKGGYVNRGFNDLDWLPEPRIEEYQGGDQ